MVRRPFVLLFSRASALGTDFISARPDGIKTMNLTIWGINYSPEPTGIAPYNTDLCEYLASRGHDVSMVTTFPYYPAWKKRSEDTRTLYRTETLAGVSIFRCWHYVPKNPNAWRRILHETSFILTSFIRLIFLPRPDLLIIVSPPLLLGPAAWLASLLKRSSFHFHVQDMQPDAALALGLLKPGLLSRFLHFLEKFTLRRAKSISGITRGMLELFLEKGVPQEKLYLLPNWILERPKNPASAEFVQGDFRKRFQIDPEALLVLYSGNLGKKQDLGIILDAAKILAKNASATNFVFVIAGQGAAEAELRQRIENESIPVQLIPLQPNEIFPVMLQDADICLVTQQAGCGAIFFPSKLITLLAAARPVITVADETSELATAVREGGFGVNVLPGDSDGLAAALSNFADDRSSLSDLGSAGFQWIQQFSRESVLQPFADYIEGALNAKQKPSRLLSPSPVAKR